jgi:hypothetical protein
VRQEASFRICQHESNLLSQVDSDSVRSRTTSNVSEHDFETLKKTTVLTGNHAKARQRTMSENDTLVQGLQKLSVKYQVKGEVIEEETKRQRLMSE